LPVLIKSYYLFAHTNQKAILNNSKPCFANLACLVNWHKYIFAPVIEFIEINNIEICTACEKSKN